MSTTLAKSFPDRFPSDEPEVEVLRGVELPKVSPKRRHGRLQWILATILDAWGGVDAEVGTEWRFRFTQEGDNETTLVPDVACVSVERMTLLSDEEAEEPPFAPDIAIEIRSPGDRERNIATKIHLYLAYGARLVLDVDPERRTIFAHDSRGRRAFGETMTFSHEATPGLTFQVADVFTRADRKHAGKTPP